MHLHSHTRSTIESAPMKMCSLTHGSEECFEILKTYTQNRIYKKKREFIRPPSGNRMAAEM